MTLTRGLVHLIRERRVGPEDLRAAERYVRDWVGSTVAGRATPAGRRLLAYGRGLADLDGRVFLAAALSHVTETDDLHRTSVTHPGCVVIPTALLLAADVCGEGDRALRGVLAGYEAMLRIGEALGAEHYRVFHNTGTAGVFGAAAAACSVLELNDEAWVWALGNAGTQASGLWQFNEDASMSKHLHAGHAASAGLRAALLAAQGFTGPAEILEGSKGFFRGLCPDPDPSAVLSPTTGWKLPETSMKPYPCCRHTHAAIDAALQVRESLGLLGDHGDAARTIASVRVLTYPAALEVTDRPSPETPYGAKFSLQYCVAASLTGGAPDLETFEPEALADDEILRVMDVTALEAGASFASAYPTRWGAEITVTCADGSEHRASRVAPVGDPECPLDDDALDRKVLGLLAHGGVTAAAAGKLLDACKALPAGGAVFALPSTVEERAGPATGS